MAGSPPTLVARLASSLEETLLATRGSLPDEVMNERLGEACATTTRIAQVPATTVADLSLKLSVLCRRLRDDLDADDRCGVLTALLAESIRDDLSLVERHTYVVDSQHNI